jgi:hypothetical protein
MSRLQAITPRFLAVAALAAGVILVGVPVASADTPVGPGGCNMLTPLFTQNPVGLGPMMGGSSNGNGAENMRLTLRSFYPSADFCGL